jgi:multiple sugar transport system ATP-binding protein
MTGVSLKGVVKKYGDVEAVRELDLELPSGQFTVLVGPSGCGKTTTLRMVAGLETVTSGTIHIGDRDVTDLEPKHRDVSMVFQNYALYPHLTVRENIAFPILARGGDRTAAMARVDEVAAALSVSQLLERKPRALSGGQQQRIAIGRAIVRSPQVFLFDEPLSNLDAKLRVEMRTEILRLQRSLGTTALYVTHDQEEAMTLSDVMVVMRDGEIAQMGAPATLYADPANVFVASFVGSPKMNLLEGDVDSGVFRTSGGFLQELSDVRSGSTTLGVRPEDVMLGSRAEPGRQARVEIVELLGPRAIVTLEVDGVGMTAVVEASDLASVPEGALVPMSLRPGALHVFDTATGVRLG